MWLKSAIVEVKWATTIAENFSHNCPLAELLSRPREVLSRDQELVVRNPASEEDGDQQDVPLGSAKTGVDISHRSDKNIIRLSPYSPSPPFKKRRQHPFAF